MSASDEKCVRRCPDRVIEINNRFLAGFDLLDSVAKRFLQRVTRCAGVGATVVDKYTIGMISQKKHFRCRAARVTDQAQHSYLLKKTMCPVRVFRQVVHGAGSGA